MRVSDDELSAFVESFDIISIGMRADEARRAIHGQRTTFVRVADVPADVGGPIDVPSGAGELRITGPPVSRKIAVDRIREVVEKVDGLPVSAFSLADLDQIAAADGVTLRALLEDLHAAGLELVAEAPVDRLQDPRRSIEEVNISGLSLGRLTIHGSSADLLPLLKRVAQLQRDVAVIRTFAPLPRTVNAAAPSTGYEDVKRVALARLVVDNVPSIQVDWSLYGPKLAQVALTVGADDLDAVSSADDGSQGSRRAPLEEVRRNIRAAGFEPAERNGRFEPKTSD